MLDPTREDYRKRELREEWTQALFCKGVALRFMRTVNLFDVWFRAEGLSTPPPTETPVLLGGFAGCENMNALLGFS